MNALTTLKTGLTLVVAPIVVAVALLGAADSGPLAPARADAARKHEIVRGPFRHDREAHHVAHEWRERGYHTHVFHEHRGWLVRIWRN
jgi:hypothetical protein